MGQQPFQSQLLHVCSALQLLSSACSRKIYVQCSTLYTLLNLAMRFTVFPVHW